MNCVLLGHGLAAEGDEWEGLDMGLSTDRARGAGVGWVEPARRTADSCLVSP